MCTRGRNVSRRFEDPKLESCKRTGALEQGQSGDEDEETTGIAESLATPVQKVWTTTHRGPMVHAGMY